MSEWEDPEFYAWADEANAGEAYLATLATIFDPLVLNHEKLHGTEVDYWSSLGGSATTRTLEEALPILREAFRQGHRVGMTIPILLHSQNRRMSPVMVCRFPRDRGGGHGCLLSVNEDRNDVMPQGMDMAKSLADFSVPVGAVIVGLLGQERVDKLFLTLCAPDGHSRVKTGAYNMVNRLFGPMYETGNEGWRAPLEMAATYHGDHLVARDVAISWLYLHDGASVDSVADLSRDAFMARVEAAPAGTSVGISSQPVHIVNHSWDELREVPIEHCSPLTRYRGPRPRYPEDDNLTREQVLATLQTPSETLLQALEACAAPDAEWLEAEKLALDVLAANKEKEGEPTQWRWLDADQTEEKNFLEEHAPYHVRRLPNGGVMLATHPYRYLWPLWSSALDLLGIRPRTT